jgi:hypothetical protein
MAAAGSNAGRMFHQWQQVNVIAVGRAKSPAAGLKSCAAHGRDFAHAA